MTVVSRARRLLTGLLAAFAVGFAAPAAAEPAIWVIRDADSTIYLFGTAHVLRPDTPWRGAKLAQAFKESSDLVLELVTPSDPAAFQPLIARYGLDPAAKLSEKLGPADAARLAAAAKAIGAPPAALEPMRPWLAAMMLSMVPLLKAGYDPKSGVETILTAEAKAASKPISGLETMEQQLRFFADMPPEAELGMLRATLDDVDGATRQIDEIMVAWSAGDISKLEAAFVTEMKRDYPEAYEVLVIRRNTAWADQLAAKMNGAGVSFVAVGAGHLVGPDSVQAELAKRGIVAERF